MDWITISLFCALEAALLLLVWTVFLQRKNAQLQRRINKLRQPSRAVESFESIESGYFSYLEKQIIDTRARLELSENETADGDELAAALGNRLALLESEKRVVELCNDYPERRWEHVTDCYRPPAAEIPDSPESEPENAAPPAGTDHADDAPASQAGQESVAQLAGIINGQGDALESFRQVFEVIRKEPDPKALEQMDKSLRELERRYREASTCIEIMEQENQRLQYKVEQGNWRLDRAEHDKHESIAALQGQVGKQKRSISELNHLIDDLQLEAEKAAELQARLDQFDLATRDMNMCIQTMEEENEFLREQIQALLQVQQDETANAGAENQRSRIEELERDLEALQALLKQKDETIAAALEKYATMEKEYLTLYEQSKS
ncbi:MAG: hypothetical protein J5I92_00545 [Thiogranum sp.]|nr:hypothetical protein [Thiogranum sp.]